mgnify:CR=1 FL=1
MNMHMSSAIRNLIDAFGEPVHGQKGSGGLFLEFSGRENGMNWARRFHISQEGKVEALAVERGDSRFNGDCIPNLTASYIWETLWGFENTDNRAIPHTTQRMVAPKYYLCRQCL